MISKRLPYRHIEATHLGRADAGIDRRSCIQQDLCGRRKERSVGRVTVVYAFKLLTVVSRSGLTVVTVPEYWTCVSESTLTLVAVACAVCVTRALRVVVVHRVLHDEGHTFSARS